MQHGQSKPLVPLLLANTIKLWAFIVSWWPGKLLAGTRGLAVTVEPVAALTAVMFRSTPRFADRVARASDGDVKAIAPSAETDMRSTAASVGMLLSYAWNAAMTLLRDCVTEGHSCVSASNPANTTAKQLLCKPVMLEVAHLLLAAAAGGLHGLQERQSQLQASGACPTAQPYHEQLWASLGCSAAGAVLLDGMKADSFFNKAIMLKAAGVACTAMMLLAALEMTQQPEDHPDSAELHPAVQQREQDLHVQATNEHQTVLKVLLEVVLLAHDSIMPHQLGASMHMCKLLFNKLQDMMPAPALAAFSSELLMPLMNVGGAVQQAVLSCGRNAEEPHLDYILDSYSLLLMPMTVVCKLLLRWVVNTKLGVLVSSGASSATLHMTVCICLPCGCVMLFVAQQGICVRHSNSYASFSGACTDPATGAPACCLLYSGLYVSCRSS